MMFLWSYVLTKVRAYAWKFAIDLLAKHQAEECLQFSIERFDICHIDPSQQPLHDCYVAACQQYEHLQLEAQETCTYRYESASTSCAHANHVDLLHAKLHVQGA